ncbi:MAG TPA: acyl carrier protein [Steroidobacteraceae bacterium]|nr:acyl carrier protein [Steroidobacteraceae bacterium]
MLNRVYAVLAETLRLAPTDVAKTADMPLLGALPELDSMNVINVITALEERFDIRIDDDEVSNETFQTLGTLTTLIEHKLKQR